MRLSSLKVIVQITILALVVNAAVHAGLAAYQHYEFADAVEQEARFGNRKTFGELHRRVVEIGESYDVPLAYDDVTVTRAGAQTSVQFSYVRTVELVPRVYMHDFAHDVNITVYPVRPITDDFQPATGKRRRR